MTQIHVNAINKSLTDNTQYILSKGAEQICVSDERKLLSCLESNWDVIGKFHNGVEEGNYDFENSGQIESIKDFVEKELNIQVKKPFHITLTFQKFYNAINQEPEEVRAYLTFFYANTGKMLKKETFRFNQDTAEKLIDMVQNLNVIQTKETLITILKKNLKKEKKL